MLNFTVDPRLEEAYEWYLHAVGLVVLPLNLFTFYLIYANTPKHNQVYRYYVMHMQVWSTLLDIHFGVLFKPMILFPLPGGYCSGLFCRAGVPMHYMLVLMYLIICGIFISMGISIFYRHQLILPEGHWLRMESSTLIVLYLIFSFAIQSPTITLLVSGGAYQQDGIAYLKTKHPAMLWLSGKDNWIAAEPLAFPLIHVAVEVVVIAIVYSTIFLTISVHLLRGISQATFMSLKTRALHRRVVLVLICQVCIVLIFLITPVPVFTISVLTERIPHEVNFAFFILITLYSWTHSIILIATTPSYRADIATRLKLPHQVPLMSETS